MSVNSSGKEDKGTTKKLKGRDRGRGDNECTEESRVNLRINGELSKETDQRKEDSTEVTYWRYRRPSDQD